MSAEEYRDGASVGAAVAAVRARIAAAASRSGRKVEDITLIAVTKGVSLERIRAAVAAGIADLGESRVQEAVPKIAALGAPVRWHLVGYLQRNKAARAAALFEVIHSVDSAALLAALGRRALHPLDVLLQVKLAGAGGRHGVPSEALAALARQAVGLPGLRVVGLMTIAPPARDPEAVRTVFRRLRELRGELGRLIGPLPHLSMGMSDDFEVAVEEGATMVRIGRAIFGPRNPM